VPYTQAAATGGCLTADTSTRWSLTTVRPLVRVTLVLGGTAAYLGLAILGWGGWSAFFAHPARVALAVALAVLAGVSLFADGNLSPGVREDRRNRWVIGAVTLLGLLARRVKKLTLPSSWNVPSQPWPLTSLVS
jgi:hypothetical protein